MEEKNKKKVNLLQRVTSHLEWWNKKDFYEETIKQPVGNRYKEKDKGLKVVLQ